MIIVAFSLRSEPLSENTRHWTLVPLYSALAGMVNSSTIVPSDVLVCETTRSLRILGGRLCSDIPFTLQPVRPPSVSHVNTAVWSRKTTVLSGAWSISDSIIQKRHIPTFHRALVYLEQWQKAHRREGLIRHRPSFWTRSLAPSERMRKAARDLIDVRSMVWCVVPRRERELIGEGR